VGPTKGGKKSLKKKKKAKSKKTKSKTQGEAKEEAKEEDAGEDISLEEIVKRVPNILLATVLLGEKQFASADLDRNGTLDATGVRVDYVHQDGSFSIYCVIASILKLHCNLYCIKNLTIGRA
jgi:hypothetical protein